MTIYSTYLPLLFEILGVLILLFYAFILNDAHKNSPQKEADKDATPAQKWQHSQQLAVNLTEQEPKLYNTAHQYHLSVGCTALFAAATIGAGLPELTGWTGVLYTWIFLCLTLVGAIVSIILWQRNENAKFEAMNSIKKKDEEKANKMGLVVDRRWHEQLMSTVKYLIASLAMFAIAIVLFLIFNN